MNSAIGCEHSPQQNSLLEALPFADRAQLGAQLELVFLPLGRVLFEPHADVRYVYFPVDSLVALLCPLAQGAADEFLLVGRQGIVGVAAFMGGSSTPQRAIVVGAGHAYRLPRRAVEDEFRRHGELAMVLLHYMLSLVNLVAQTVVCNRHHSVEQRLCRWLLLCLDATPGRQFELTHGLLAQLLGVRRESVSGAAATLRLRGAIDYQRGRLTILDRDALNALACECYQVVKSTEADVIEAQLMALEPDTTGRAAPRRPGSALPLASLQPVLMSA